MSVIHVLAPGLLTTVQDLGRPGHAAAGVSACGAADAVALRLGNQLVGNPEGAAALEMTLQGATLQFAAAAWVALTGAPCAASRQPAQAEESSVPMWTALAVAAGETLRCRAIREGARTYLCIAGGLAVPLFLGSAATHVRSGLGGHLGRPLRAGDALDFVPGRPPPRPRSVPPTVAAALYPPSSPRRLRVTSGPQRAELAAAFAALLAGEYQVSAHSDRMGVRLVGAPLPGAGGQGAAAISAVGEAGAPPGELLSQGVFWGAVQLPADGQPIVLAVDHQTTGGYPILAAVIAADRHRLGQLRPGDRLRFAEVSLEEADALLAAQEALLAGPGGDA